MSQQDHILVIKLSALGDFIQATGAMKAIRAHHTNAHITLLTTKPFEKIAAKTGYFDSVLVDQKPRWYDIGAWLNLRSQLNQEEFARVYDLQNNDRTNLYFKLFNPKPEWVGIAKGASHRNTSASRTAGHALDGHIETLAIAGIAGVEVDDLSWLDENVERYELEKPYVLLVPGSAPEHPQKRWPAKRYAELAGRFSREGYNIAVLGTDIETPLAEEMQKISPQVIDLTGRTSLGHISALARNAAGVIGNDTGPMHIAAATAIPCLTVFSSHSNPLRHAPKGEYTEIIQSDDLNKLGSKDVYESFIRLQKEAK